MIQYSIWIQRPPAVDSWQPVTTHLTLWVKDSGSLQRWVEYCNRDGVVVLSAMEIQEYRELKC